VIVINDIVMMVEMMIVNVMMMMRIYMMIIVVVVVGRNCRLKNFIWHCRFTITAAVAVVDGAFEALVQFTISR
jgi:hypothetical protein